MQVLYVYPNVLPGIYQRGGLLERWGSAKINNCEFIEIPADFIKNITEIKKTGQNVCECLKDESIKEIYSKQSIDNKLIMIKRQPTASLIPMKFIDTMYDYYIQIRR